MTNQRTRRAFGAALLALCLFATVPTFGAGEASTEGVVNVNQASLEELTLLPRVGPTVAGRILEHREENGPFASPEELMLVRGIGESTFAGMEAYVVTEGKTTLTTKVKLPKKQPAEGDRQ